MRRPLFCLLILCLPARPAPAAPSLDQPFPELKLMDGRVLKNARIKSFNSTSVFVRDDDGFVQVPYGLFPAELQPQLAAGRAAATPPPPPPPPPPPSPATMTREQMIIAVTAQKNDAIRRVQEIVNQPITHLQRTSDMKAAHFPYWFHPGAIVPDFDHVDVRASQDVNAYAHYQYIYSDLSPNEAFLGSELEFNSMTKYFYTDRSVPKKKLTEDEMLTINRLYRIIGACNRKLTELNQPLN